MSTKVVVGLVISGSVLLALHWGATIRVGSFRQYYPGSHSSHRSLQLQQTSVPIYYTNLDGSTARRAHTERTFGNWGKLVRVSAVDARDKEQIDKHVDTHGLAANDYFKGKGRASGAGSGALLVSKTLAVKQAYDDGEKVMLLLEDDMSDMLSYYWRYSLDEIFELANKLHPGWLFIQLQCLFESKARPFFGAWKVDPSTPFFPRDKIKPTAYPWGAGAVLISRDGMKDLIGRLMVGEGGKFDCLPEVERLRAVGCKCHPDNFLWRLDNPPEKLLLVLPPMFTTTVNEGSTGIRKDVSNGQVENDHEGVHLEGAFAALRANVLAKAESTFQRDFNVTMTAKESNVGYMEVSDDILGHIVNNTAG